MELEDARPDALVILEQLLPKLAKVPAAYRPRRQIVVRAGDLLEAWKRPAADWLARWRGRSWPRWPQQALAFHELLQTRTDPVPVPLSPADPAFLQYTGGTTGTPKGAVLSHANLLANVEQVRLWLTCSGWRRPLRPGRERLVTALPLSHIFALTANLWVGLSIGSHNQLVPDPRNLRDLVRVLRRSRFTAITGVNTLFDHLLRAPGFARLDFSHLGLTVAGGMPMHPTVAERWQAVTGCPVIEGYGLTEASPVVTLNPLDLERYNGSIGLPLPGTDCRLRRDGEDAPPGEAGELCVRGPQVMQGYWNRPEETAATFTADGWLRTGDIARMDADGFFYIVDRKKDMILVSGFNVYPSEIEAVVSQHPGVRECAAVGVPDPDTGEAVMLFVVRQDPDLDESALRAWCRERLTAYKRPRRIVFLDELPKSAIGKVLRRQLREAARARI
ncbi:long-chain acyl-CoA synthetase [Methylomarinovum caldicuralii]|uniref:Long-chain-fatty-acid--CoA ligase n=1 Tax=Methylomarinovum caldicuralii TaxID=438856 RepID=A0AAU9C5M4_9GAMM|nr:AMP-binding protein [Methylomarinovum caldicuralii]BCX80706.1 long-chain acyl-CoA synthetase [Methylomarinovum caldicuralii]